MTNELQLLIEALEKKKRILEEILEKSKEQNVIANAKSFDAESFDRLVDEKTGLLEQMDLTDSGFDAIFKTIRDELLANRASYKQEIGDMQRLIKETVDLGAQICASESRTKESMSAALGNRRHELIKQKVSSKSVKDYYKANTQLDYLVPYFIDQKK